MFFERISSRSFDWYQSRALTGPKKKLFLMKTFFSNYHKMGPPQVYLWYTIMGASFFILKSRLFAVFGKIGSWGELGPAKLHQFFFLNYKMTGSILGTISRSERPKLAELWA